MERWLLPITDRAVGTTLCGDAEIMITTTFPKSSAAPFSEVTPYACEYCIFKQLKRCVGMVCTPEIEQNEDGEDVPVFRGSAVIHGPSNGLRPPCKTRDMLWFRLTRQKPKEFIQVLFQEPRSSSDGLSVHDYQ